MTPLPRPRPTPARRRTARGLTVVEIAVAAVLAAVVLLGGLALLSAVVGASASQSAASQPTGELAAADARLAADAADAAGCEPHRLDDALVETTGDAAAWRIRVGGDAALVVWRVADDQLLRAEIALEADDCAAQQAPALDDVDDAAFTVVADRVTAAATVDDLPGDGDDNGDDNGDNGDGDAPAAFAAATRDGGADATVDCRGADAGDACAATVDGVAVALRFHPVGDAAAATLTRTYPVADPTTRARP